jgi:hypothetical protein
MSCENFAEIRMCVTAVKGLPQIVSNRNQKHGSQQLELKRTLWNSYRTLNEPLSVDPQSCYASIERLPRAAMKKTTTRPRLWKSFAAPPRPTAGGWIRRVSVRNHSDRGARSATHGPCPVIRRRRAGCLLPVGTLLHPFFAEAAAFFAAFTLADRALCVAAIFLRAAADSVRFPRIGTTLAVLQNFAQRALWAAAILARADLDKLVNQFAFRHSSRSRPLKLSM